MIQGEGIFGAAWQGGTDTAHVIADIQGIGQEWDIYCYQESQRRIQITVNSGHVQWNLTSKIEGLTPLNTLPPNYTIEIAVGNITNTKLNDLLCAVGDGSTTTYLTVLKFNSNSSEKFYRVGALEGESMFIIKQSKIIEAPIGVKGLARRYQWNGNSFDELQEPTI